MMKEQNAFRRFLIVCALFVLAAPLIAQQPSPAGDDQQLKNQLQTFEAILQTAVKHGAEAFAQQVVNSIPEVRLTTDDPEVRGFAPPTPDGGLMFIVIVPEVRQIVTYLLRQYPRPFPAPAGVNSAAGGRGGRSVGATGPATADPMTLPPVVPGSSAAVPFDPNVVYTKAVSDALIDAMLDNSGGLPLKESEWLTIAAIDAVGPIPGAVNSPFGQTTYLSIKGSDLMQLRQGKISKAEARKLVVFKQL